MEGIELEFFRVFGIGYKREYGTLSVYDSNMFSEPIKFTPKYPEITDTIILKLMCILANYNEFYDYKPIDYKYIKTDILYRVTDFWLMYSGQKCGPVYLKSDALHMNNFYKEVKDLFANETI